MRFSAVAETGVETMNRIVHIEPSIFAFTGHPIDKEAGSQATPNCRFNLAVGRYRDDELGRHAHGGSRGMMNGARQTAKLRIRDTADGSAKQVVHLDDARQPQDWREYRRQRRWRD
jgi:hypothetical protein